jgi:hypothetical protein
MGKFSDHWEYMAERSVTLGGSSAVIEKVFFAFEISDVCCSTPDY